MEKDRFWNPSDPPDLDALKDWCAAEVEQAVRLAVEEPTVYLICRDETAPPIVVFATDFYVATTDDDEDDNLSYETPLFELLQHWLEQDPENHAAILKRMVDTLLT